MVVRDYIGRETLPEDASFTMEVYKDDGSEGKVDLTGATPVFRLREESPDGFLREELGVGSGIEITGNSDTIEITIPPQRHVSAEVCWGGLYVTTGGVEERWGLWEFEVSKSP